MLATPMRDVSKNRRESSLFLAVFGHLVLNMAEVNVVNKTEAV